jgi:hypothetical protein
MALELYTLVQLVKRTIGFLYSRLAGSDCFEVSMQNSEYAIENSWSILDSDGNECSSPASSQFLDYNVYSLTCCLASGVLELTCHDSYGDGWHGGYLTIGDSVYCDTFLSGSSMTTTITGPNQISLCCPQGTCGLVACAWHLCNNDY